MKILTVHNRYQHAGGEDEVVRAEAALLRDAGHDVVVHTRTNDEIAAGGMLADVRLAAGAVWSPGGRSAVAAVLARFKPDVAHFHNTLPLVSPAAYYACRDAGVPVVQTLHNYRLICPAGHLFRAGRLCEDCVGGLPWRGVKHACYRGSRAATATVAAMLTVHRALGTWRDQVAVYVALSEFARDRFVAAGLPAGKMAVKPNFIHPDPGRRGAPGDGAVFVGRFWPEKGARTMLDAWARLQARVPLDVIGDGPERAALEGRAAGIPHVRLRGRLPRSETLAAIKRARVLVFPSEWYEGLPMTIIESFACGVPVIASRLGTMAEVVSDGGTGLHFTPGDAEDLAAKVEWAWSHPAEMEAMGRAARAEFERRYTASRNYDQLMSIYEQAIAMSPARISIRRTDPAGMQVLSDEAADSLQGATHG